MDAFRRFCNSESNLTKVTHFPYVIAWDLSSKVPFFFRIWPWLWVIVFFHTIPRTHFPSCRRRKRFRQNAKLFTACSFQANAFTSYVFFFSSLIKSLIFFFSLSCFMLHASCMHELHDVRESSKKAYDAEQIKNDIHSHCVRVGQKKNGQPHLFTYKFSFACTPVEYRYVTYSWIHARTSHTPYRIRYLLYESWTMEYINAPFERPYMAFL